MMPSLDSAISGLKGSQTMMDVVGNNISNVNTAGFKSSQVNFADLLSQTMRGASYPNNTGLGGTNPIQVGQGVTVASIDTNFTNGSMQQTGVETNLGINGDGFFILAPTPTSGSNQLSYTRDGDFSFDANGDLVSNANGMYVEGWTAGANGKIDNSSAIGKITIPLDNTSVPASDTKNVTLSGNLDSDSTTPQDVIASVFDSLGNQYQVTLQLSGTATAGKWHYEVPSIVGPNGKNVAGVAGSGTIQFNTSGTVASVTAGPALSFTPLSGATVPAAGITLHLSGLTQYATATTASVQTQDGVTSGNLTSYTIDQTGTITGTFSNGEKLALAQIALQNFPNPGGLQADGTNLYSATANSNPSGNLTPSTAGTGSLGTLQAGSLEASNVDLSQEMSNMIIAQSAFDANSKVITTDDNLLQTLDNMIPV